MSLIKSPQSPPPARQGSGQAVALHLQQFVDSRSTTMPAYLRALARLCDGQHTLAWWVGRYLALRVSGGSPHTLAARSRDLTAFIQWFIRIYGHGDITQWHIQSTRSYLTFLGEERYAPTSINRALSSLKHFARWAHEQPDNIFARYGVPTADVKDLIVDEADCKKLSTDDVQALFAAAKRATQSPGHPMSRPMRNQAILALLYYTGLRVSEVVILRREQYAGHHLVQVSRKGRTRSRSVYLCQPCRQYLDAYLEQERPGDVTLAPGAGDDATLPLFVSAKSGGYLDRRRMGRLLERLAQVASTEAHLVTAHPHRLRHTFGSIYRNASGSDSETAAALGHAGLQYVGRYTRKTQSERDDLLERMFAQDAHNTDDESDDTGSEEIPP